MEQNHINEAVRRGVRRDNIEYHREAAPLYDLSNPGLYNLYERYLLGQDMAVIRELLEGTRAPLCLDAGAGTGRLALILASYGWPVVAIDLSEDMLRICARRAERAAAAQRVWPVCIGVEEFLASTPARFHLIAFSAVLHHLADYFAALDMAVEKLKPGGVLYVTHEPDRRQGHETIASRALRFFDHMLRLPLQLRKHIPRLLLGLPRPKARQFTDYHSPKGCDAEEIVARLRQQGMDLVRLRRYRPRCTAPAAFLDTTLGISPDCHFRLIARRP